MTNGDVIEPTLPAAEEVPSPTFLEEDSKADPLNESWHLTSLFNLSGRYLFRSCWPGEYFKICNFPFYSLSNWCAVADPDFEISGGGGTVIQTRDKGGGAVSKRLFSALWATVWSSKKPDPSPRSAAGVYWALISDNLKFDDVLIAQPFQLCLTNV